MIIAETLAGGLYKLIYDYLILSHMLGGKCVNV